MSTIHQEVVVAAPIEAVYRALLDPHRFEAMTGAPATGEPREGGSFSAFGGHVSGRHVELVADRRIVQAWRAKTWPEGTYSIARFELSPSGEGTKIVFDHEGFPADLEAHLASGWKANYWAKLETYVARA